MNTRNNISCGSSGSDKRIPKEEMLHSSVKKLLQGRVFVGKFIETLHVDSLKCYRNVVVVDDTETKLIRDLLEVQSRLKKFYNDGCWIGISNGNIPGAPTDVCLWTQLSEEIFGSYFYQIRKVKFRSKEVFLYLEALRPINLDTTPNLSTSNLLGTSKSHQFDMSSIMEISFDNLLPKMKIALLNFYLFLNEVITQHNIKESIKFVFLMLVALFAASIKFFEFLGDFSIRLLHEISNFVRISTPIILAIIDMICKMVGGFYLLVLGMWRDSNRRPIGNPRINYNSNRQKMLM